MFKSSTRIGDGHAATPANIIRNQFATPCIDDTIKMDHNSKMDHGASPNGDGGQTPGQQRLYRLDSNHSVSSIFKDVEMAHEEVSAPILPPQTVNLQLTYPPLSCSQDQWQRACRQVSLPFHIDGAERIPRLASHTMTRKLKTKRFPRILMNIRHQNARGAPVRTKSER